MIAFWGENIPLVLPLTRRLSLESSWFRRLNFGRGFIQGAEAMPLSLSASDCTTAVE